MVKTMNSKGVLYVAVLLALFSTIKALDIQKTLSQYPELGLFNQYIGESNLASPINNRGTITVLGVDNSSLSSISGKSKEVIKAIISVHIILDYFDEKKLKAINNDSTLLTTFYQTSGLANNQLGFLAVKNGHDGVSFGSAANNAPLNSKYVKTIVTQPYNVSVLQVSQTIIPPGIESQNPYSQTPYSAPPAPPPSKNDKGGAQAEAPADGDDAEAPDDDADAEAPADGAEAPDSSEAPAGANDGGDGRKMKSPPKSPASRVQTGLMGTAIVAFASLLVAL